MNKKSVWIGLSSYVLWGVLPLYWNLLHSVDSMIILCNRVLWSAVFAVLVLAVQKRLPLLKQTFCDRHAMRYLVPSALLIAANWGIYIWSVTHAHTLDASLGYYLNPLMSFALGLLLFRERCNALEYIAIAVAALGVAISTISYGAFPGIALLLGVTFAAYGAVKKMVHVDAIVSIAIEAILVSPIMLAYLLLSPAGHATFAAMTAKTAFLLVMAGPLTALPLMLFSRGVNDLPLSTMGFLQFASPTLMALMGVCFLGERFTGDRIVAFGFIFLALLLYTIGLVLHERKTAELSGANALK